MTNLLHGAHVANKLFSTIARLRLLLVMFVTLSVSAEVWGAEDVSTFTSTSFTGLSSSWSRTSSGTLGYEAARGVQHQKNATTTFTATGFSNVTKVQVWVAKSNNGKGSVKIQENTTAVKTISSFNTSSTEQSYTWTTPYTGTLKIVVNATASSIYIKKIVVTTAAATTYTVTYDLNGGTGTIPTQANVAADGTFTLAASSGFSNVGYSFAGWNDGTKTYNAGDTYTMPAKAVTLKAQWTELPKYTVTLNAGPGTCAESVTESSAGAGVELLEPTLDCGDWKFAGWTTSAVATETSSKPATLLTGTYKPTANTTLYAVYQRTETPEGVETTTTTTDILTRATTGITSGAGYGTWSGKTSNSLAVYAGQSAGGNDAIQLRTTNSNSGIITTASGGKATKITVEWNSNTADGRTLDIYGKNSAYSAATDLYSTSTQGTKLGSIVNGTSTELTITGDYEYIGLRSNSNAMYLTSISIDWATTTNGGASTTTYYHSTPECNTETTVTLNPNGGTFTSSTPDGWEKEGDNYTKEVDGSVDLPTPTKTGYKFDGWYDGTTEVSSSYTPSKNVTLTAQWTAKTTNITLNANTNNHGSGSNSSIKATYNQTLPSFTACTPATGYTLNGYFTAETGGTKVIDKDGKLVSGVSGYTSADGKWANESANLTLYAQYVASQYTVTFDANDGTGTMEPQTFEHGVSQSLSANQFTREHYTFAGWNTVEDGSGQSVNDKGEVTVYANITLYAQWTAIKYTITLNAAIDNPVTVPGVTNADGATLTAATPCDACEEEGWIFVGWKEDSPLEETTTEPTNLHEAGVKYHPTRNVNLYPVYSKTDEVFGFTKYEKVTSAPSDWSGKYLISNGTQTATGTQFSKSALAIANFIPGTEEKTEYEFTISKDGNDDNYYILSPDGTYYVGGTTGNNNKADLIFSDNPNEDKYLWILSASDPMTQNKASNRYIGVGTESNTNVFKQYSTSGTNAKCYLYKRIEETSSTTTYNSNPSCVPTHTITWMNGDDVLGQDKVEEGKTPEYAGDEPTKAADAQYTYTFKGWTPNIVEATADATYTATYTATVNKYTITWKNGETTLENDENVPYGTEPSYNGATPTKAATAQYTYTFNSWDPEVTSVTGDAIYTAKFDASINHYTVTFEMNGHGTAPVNQTIAYGSKVSEPSAPTADGYEFAGWYKDEACTEAYDFSSTITGDLPLYAKWLNIYTITWKANGLEYTTTKVTEGNPITSPPSSPDLGDYCGQVFVGWTTAEMEETTNVAPTLYPNPTPFPTATEEAPKTYYAVFADYKN